jgi:hypothetical protein
MAKQSSTSSSSSISLSQISKGGTLSMEQKYFNFRTINGRVYFSDWNHLFQRVELTIVEGANLCQ